MNWPQAKVSTALRLDRLRPPAAGAMAISPPETPPPWPLPRRSPEAARSPLFCCSGVPAETVALPKAMPASLIISRRRGMAASSAWRTSGWADMKAASAWSLVTVRTTCTGPRSGGFRVRVALWSPPAAIHTTFCPSCWSQAGVPTRPVSLSAGTATAAACCSAPGCNWAARRLRSAGASLRIGSATALPALAVAASCASMASLPGSALPVGTLVPGVALVLPWAWPRLSAKSPLSACAMTVVAALPLPWPAASKGPVARPLPSALTLARAGSSGAALAAGGWIASWMLPTRASISAAGSAGGGTVAAGTLASAVALSLVAGASLAGADGCSLLAPCSASACIGVVSLAGAWAGACVAAGLAGRAAADACTCACSILRLAWRCSIWRFRVRWKSPAVLLVGGWLRLAAPGVAFGEIIWEIGVGWVCMMLPQCCLAFVIGLSRRVLIHCFLVALVFQLQRLFLRPVIQGGVRHALAFGQLPAHLFILAARLRMLDHLLLALDGAVELDHEGLKIAVGHGRNTVAHARLEALGIVVAVAGQHVELLAAIVERFQGRAEALGAIVRFALGKVNQGCKLGRRSHA